MPDIILIRHAEAEDTTPDARRPLTAHGRKQVDQLVAFFHANGKLSPAQVWHSPYARAVETAERLAKGLKWKARLTETDGLEPHHDPNAMALRLERATGSVAVVGHEPFLSALASILVADRPYPPVVEMKKGACLALSGGAGFWHVRWFVTPGML